MSLNEVAELIRRAVGCAALNAAACQQKREAADMMIAAIPALGHRRAAG